jgi:hypothetical protein
MVRHVPAGLRLRPRPERLPGVRRGHLGRLSIRPGRGRAHREGTDARTAAQRNTELQPNTELVADLRPSVDEDRYAPPGAEAAVGSTVAWNVFM